eukprot:s2092_g7.t1
MPDTSGCDCEDDQEEQLLRMFEDESVISSSEEEQIDKDECAIQAVQDDKKRQKEVDAWRLHIENGHVPFRRDCHHCILGSAINRQHRRVKHPTSYSLSVDLFGPLQTHERGRDEESEPPIQVGSKDDGKYDDHLSDYEPSELEEWSQQPLEDHNTLGEVPAQIPERSEIRLPWDDEVLPADDDLLLEYADELKTPVEQVVLRFMIGLKSKTGVDVAAGVQRLVLHINRDYPVRVLHCGPGTEFTSDRLKVWLSNQGVRLQHTLPTDKRSNGLAERTVGLLKARARTLLSSAALAAQYWPLAMRYACESHNRQVLGQPPLPIFGQRVLHRLKKPSGALNELMNRWVTTRYMTPHLSIPEGHMLINSEGNLVASKGFRANVVDPSAIEDLDFPALVVDDVTHLDEPEPPALSVVPPALAESPPKVDKKENAMKPFPLLPRLDISGCPLNMDVWKLLKPLMYNNKLFALEASGCNLTGKVENMAQISARPSYFGLYILDLSKNNINALEGKPLDTCLYDLTGNPLEQISEHYFTMPGKLDIRATNFSSTRNGSIEWHSNHSKSWSELFDIANTSFTRNHSVCSWVTSVDNPRCELLVSPETFAPDRLCQCRDFYGGSGVDCIKCPGPSMKDPLNHTRRCCTCENGKARATIDNETDLRCFRCFGSGCEGRNCTAYCSVGHSGSLCRTCAENYAYAPRPHSLRCEKCAADARGGSRRLLMLLLAVVLIVVVSICQWWCVYRVQKRSSIERGQRTQEFIDQSLLMVTFVQLLQMVHASIASSSRQTVLDAGSAAGGFQILLTAAQLRIADALRLLNVQCYFEQEYGLFLERLSSAFLLPGICLVAMCVGACRHSVFLALRNCILLMKLLFIGTIEVTLSNLACITADADREKLPPEAHFLKEFPWTRCDALGAPLRLALWLAFVLNALLLPLSFVILAWYMNRQVQPLWSWCRWLRPNFSAGPKGFTLWWGVPPGALEGDGCPEQYLSMLRKSSQVFLAAHAACLLPGLGLPETLDITTSLQKAAPDVGEMPESEQGKHRTNLVVECETKDGWVDMSPSRLERLLSGAREEAMALGDMLLYRQASHQVLKRSLWIGARSAFESFATTDPLLFVGLDKVVVLAITSLCLKKDLAGVATFFGILAVGILRAQPYGTRSRNHLGFACCLALAGYSLCLLLALSIWHDPEWALGTGARFAACAGPFCCYLHLQLAPADMTIEAYKLLAHLKGFDSEKGAGQSYMSAEGSSAAVAAPDSLPDHEVLHVPAAPPAAWTFEQRWPVRWLFHGYRLRIRPWLLSPCVQLLEEVESRALRGVGEVVQRVGGRNTVDGIEMSEVSSLRSRSCGPV